MSRLVPVSFCLEAGVVGAIANATFEYLVTDMQVGQQQVQVGGRDAAQRLAGGLLGLSARPAGECLLSSTLLTYLPGCLAAYFSLYPVAVVRWTGPHGRADEVVVQKGHLSIQHQD